MIYEAVALILFLTQGISSPFLVEDLYIALCVFPTLLILLGIEKNPKKPFAFVTPAKPLWSGIGLLICIVTPLIVKPLLHAAWFHEQIIWPNILNLVYATVNPVLVAYEFHVALSEESIKVMLINVFGWWTGKLEPRKRQFWISLAMIGSVGLWAIGHLLFGGYDLEAVVGAFVVGLVWVLVVYRLKNFAPAIVGHWFWNLFLI